MAPPDQRQRRRRLVERSRRTAQVRDEHGGGKIDATARCRDTTGKRHLERAEVDSVRRLEQALQGQAHRTTIGRAHELAQGAEARQRAEQFHLAGIGDTVTPRPEHPVERAVRTKTPRHRIFHLERHTPRHGTGRLYHVLSG